VPKFSTCGICAKRIAAYGPKAEKNICVCRTQPNLTLMRIFELEAAIIECLGGSIMTAKEERDEKG
jgi:hypothetical protein